MKVLKLLLLIMFIISLVGCTINPISPIIKTEYVTVEIPVKHHIDKPNRPKFDKSRLTTPEYLSDILNYTKILETIIEEYNSSALKNESNITK